MEILLKKYEESVNQYFVEVATELFEKRKQEWLKELDSKKTEIILGMVRDISKSYNMRHMGDLVTITINEIPKT